MREVRAAPAAAWAALADWGGWWDGAHSYSGTAANLRLDPVAGGCLCERWAGGAVEHGRVLLALPPRTLRLNAPLGPLQALPGTAVLTVTIAPNAGGSRITMTMRAAGSVSDRYDVLAPLVDDVLGKAADRLAKRL